MRITYALITCAMAAGLASCAGNPTSPTSTSTITSPMTESFSSLLTVKGTASRSFSTHGLGTVSITLSSTSPAGMIVGIGVGIPRSNGAGCNLSASALTVAESSAQVSVTADTGEYCAQVYDPGTLGEQLAFTLSISHP